MRNIKLVLRVVLALVFAVSITGCSNAKNNADEILSDLENAGFKTNVSKIFDALSELSGNSNYDMTCTIMNNAEFDTTNIYQCNVVCSNSDFEISYDLKVTYVKNDGWNFSGYEIVKTSSKIKSEIPEERIIDDISTQFAKGGKTVNIVDGSVSQTLSNGSIGCKATATGEVAKGILTEKCEIFISYSFSDKWDVYATYSRNSYEWNVQALAGKKWVDSHPRSEGDFIYIESVDESNSTMMVGYRKGLFSSTIDGLLEEHGKPIKCRYELEEDCIKIMTGDFTLEISPEMGTLMSGYITYPEN